MTVETKRSRGRETTIIEPTDLGAWDELVTREEGGTFCHLSGWREVMTDLLGAECLYRAVVDRDGRWLGVLPLVRVRSRLFGHYLVSVPFLNYGGPLGAPAAQHALLAWAIAEAGRSGADLLELRSRISCAFEGGEDVGSRDAGEVGESIGGDVAGANRADPQGNTGGDGPPAGLRRSDRKLTVVLDLPETSEALWSQGLSSKLRSQIRRPRKEGMTTVFGEAQAGAFYEVFSRNMRDLGTPVLPRRLFEALPRIFPGEVRFGAVYQGDRPVAAGCGFLWGGEFEMTWASSLREYNPKAPNMLLYWSFMEMAIDAGARVFNFGRCSPGSGTHRFKSQWGGRDLALPWLQWSRRGVSATPSPDRPLYRRAATAWSRMPLGVANIIGPRLARRLP